jgi:hypothetical protein
MEELKTWLEQQLQERLVEPNSRLGGAFDYLLKRWEALTRFLHIPGAPLDDNTAERALKIILRYRKNSLFYKNEHGAYVGDVLTSLMETCRLARANPLDYLRALMENRSAVFADPGGRIRRSLEVHDEKLLETTIALPRPSRRRGTDTSCVNRTQQKKPRWGCGATRGFRKVR